MLLTPGFITDTIGLLGLIPWSRAYFISHILEKNASKVFNQRNSVFIHKDRQPKADKKQERKNDAIEGEFWED